MHHVKLVSATGDFIAMLITGIQPQAGDVISKTIDKELRKFFVVERHYNEGSFELIVDEITPDV